MLVQEICSRTVFTIAGTNSVREAAQKMLAHHVGTLVVAGEGTKPVGIVTDRDIVTRCVAKEFDPDDTPVDQIMTGTPKTVEEETTLEEALEMMADLEIRRLVVVDGRDRIAGLLSLDDVLEKIIEDAEEVGRLLRGQVHV